MKRYIYLFLLLLTACIDPYETEVEQGQQYLTIDGTITSVAQVHRVRLTRGDTYGSIFQGLIRPVTGATVIVRDNLGEVTFLEENEEDRGYYETPATFAAVVGRSYSLQIQLVDGKVYTSFPEKVEAAPLIKSLGYQSQRIPVEGEVNDASGVQLIVDIDDPADQNNFYYFRNSEATYVLETRPDLYTTPPPDRSPAPKDCCFTCFQTETVGNQSYFISSDDNFNGLSTRLIAGFIPDNGRRFVNTYRIDLRQLNVSQEAYRFLRLVKQQSEISGSVFDPPPANIRGNMISLDDPEEVVLGFFIAAGESKKRVYIKNSDLDFVQNIAIIPDDCRVVPGASLLPPFDWRPNE
ncbi:DUF4249 domain-containing protein [Algoriphagus marinus]|uniref:DUF4249 domain-containing protein n=1 Tax=Algoriphagus marinus TaxID=1925762 RepID=UPI00094B8593|nr:DUF4249 domain-containing protein [Algoriphagus marinus]